MSRKIYLEPNYTLYYIVDANFFANKYLKPRESLNTTDRDRIENSHAWWEVVDWQVNNKIAIVFVNDLCIAETYKVIAKKYYQDKVFKYNRYKAIRKKITNNIQLSISNLVSKSRYIRYHNITVDRDIIVGASRYLEIAHKHNMQSISVIDLTILSSAKYLMDFYRIKKEQIIILTGDRKIIKCARYSNEGPSVIDPLEPKNKTENFFINF
ncbi:MAG TPA: hypothetical protein VIL99_10330 [Ignavibacteria bacterium]